MSGRRAELYQDTDDNTAVKRQFSKGGKTVAPTKMVKEDIINIDWNVGRVTPDQ